MAGSLSQPLLPRRDPRRARVRRARRARRDARERPRARSGLATASRQPAYAGVVTGSFVTEPDRAAASRTAAVRLAQPAVTRGDRADVRRLAGPRRVAAPARAIVVRARAVGQHVRVHASPSRSAIIGGYLYLQRRYADPLDRVHPAGGRAGDAALRVEPAVGDRAARARAPERAAADDPCRDGGHQPTASSRRASRPASPISSRVRTTASTGCRRTRSSTRSPIARSSSASRSSRR